MDIMPEPTTPRTIDEPMTLACTFRTDGYCLLHGGLHAELTVPEPADDERPPGDVAELRAAAVTALQALLPESREQADDALLFWARRREMTADDVEAVLDAMFPAEVSHMGHLDCPDWCTFDHRQDDERDDLVLHQGADHVDGTVRKLLELYPDGGAKLDVRVSRTDDAAAGTVGVPNLYVRCEVELTTWEQAAELARTILDGFGYLKGA